MLKRKFEETEGLAQDGEGANPESDDSNCSAGSTDALAPDALGQPPAKRTKKKVNFKGVTVYYFPRRQGFTCVPSEGGSTLGMSEKHTFHRDFSLSDYTKEQKRIHRAILAEQRRQGKLFPSPLLGNASLNLAESTDDISSGSESDSEYDDYYFLQPLPIRQRRVLLRTAGVKKIDNEEKDECRDIRVSRNVCGCDCKIFCDPETCACSLAGIQCQVDRLSFPCGCTKDGCANPSGRIEFNPIRVKTHFIHTLMRLELERKDREIQDGSNPNGSCVLGNSSSLPSSSLSSHSTMTSEDSHKIVDVVGEDSEPGMDDGEDESKVVVKDSDTKVRSEEVEDCQKAANQFNSDINCNSSSSENICLGNKTTLKSNLKTKKEESIDLNLFNSNERGSCRDCQNTDMCNVMMHDVKFSMVSQQQRQQQQQQQQRAMAQSLFSGQQILHSHSLSPTSPGLSLFQPLPQQSASVHHHMMMFGEADEGTSYHADNSGQLYFDNDDTSYPEINEASSDNSFPGITHTSSGNFRTGSSVMFTTTMNTNSLNPGSGPVSSTIRIMRPQVSLLNRSSMNQFGIRPVEICMPNEFASGSTQDLGTAPICNGVSSSLSPASQQQQQQPSLLHQHGLLNPPLLNGSKAVTDTTSEHCNSQHLVSSMESTSEDMPGVCPNLSQTPTLNQPGILNESDNQNRPLVMPVPGEMPALSLGFSDPSNSHVCGNFHTNLVSSHGKSSCDQLKQDMMTDQNYSSVLTVPVFHSNPSHSEEEYETTNIATVTTVASTTISINHISSTADSANSDTTLHHQPLLSCWNTSLSGPSIPDCFAGMGSNSLVPSSLISQSGSEPNKSESGEQAHNIEVESPSQTVPSPSSTTYTTMTTTTRDQLAAYCPGISSHMDSRSETREAKCGPVAEPETALSDFPISGEDAKPTSSLLADSQSILFNSFSQASEPNSTTLVPASSTSIPNFSSFVMSSTSEGKILAHYTSSEGTSTSPSDCSRSPPIQNGHLQETPKEQNSNEQSDVVTQSSEVNDSLISKIDTPDLQCDVTQSDTSNQWPKTDVHNVRSTVTTIESHQENKLVGGQDNGEFSKLDFPNYYHLDNDKNIHKSPTGLVNCETSPKVPSTSTISSLPTFASSTTITLSSLSSPSLSSSSTSSSSSSSASSSDDEHKSMTQEFDHIVKKPMAEMVSA